MADERCDFTIRACQADALVDPAREMGNAVLKVLPVDLHNVGFVLNDRDLGGFGHFACGIAEAVFGHDGIRVDDEDDLSDAERLAVDCRTVSDYGPARGGSHTGPGPPLAASGLVHFFNSHLQGQVLQGHRSFVFIPAPIHSVKEAASTALKGRPGRSNGVFIHLEACKVLLEDKRQFQSVVHVRGYSDGVSPLIDARGIKHAPFLNRPARLYPPGLLS